MTWRWYEAVAVLLVGYLLIGQLLIGSFVLRALGETTVPSGGADGPQIAAGIAADLAWIIAMVVWLVRRHPGWREELGVPLADLRRELGAGVVAGLVLYPAVVFGAGLVIAVLFRAFFGNDISAPEQLASHLSPLAKVGSVIFAVVLAPIAEETFFRGALFRSIRDRNGFWLGAIVSSALFGLSHYVPSPWQDALLLQTVMVFTGFGLAWIYERRGSLVTNIVAHATFNVIGILLILTAR